MAAPYYNAIKGTTAGTPGTGAFTPDAASAGCRAWSTVPSDWIGMVRFEDGSGWELSWCFWNGATLSRGANQLYDSSSGSILSLTSAATAAMVIEASELMSHLGGTPWRSAKAVPSVSTISPYGMTAATVTGTAAAGALAETNLLTQQARVQLTSATTASALAGLTWTSGSSSALTSSVAGMGGWEFTCRFGASGLPTGPRVHIGMISSASNGQITAAATEPSARIANLACLSKDSTDTTLQFLTNSNAGGGTKIDTGITMAANDWFEICIWCEPGSTQVNFLLFRLNAGDIVYKETSTDVPASGTFLFPNVQMGLNATNTGTAVVLNVGSVVIREGF